MNVEIRYTMNPTSETLVVFLLVVLIKPARDVI